MPFKTQSADSFKLAFKAPPQTQGPPDLKVKPLPDLPNKMQPKEKDVQDAIIERLLNHGWVVVRVNSGGFIDKTGAFVKGYIIHGMNAFSGFPDLVAFKGNQYLLIECKDWQGDLSQAQVEFRDYAARRDVNVRLLRHPSQLDAVLEEVQS